MLYWMQQSQRVHYNHALNFAIAKSIEVKLPLHVLFVLTDEFPDAESAHYVFMLEGLIEVRDALAKLGIPFFLEIGNPIDVVSRFSIKASSIVFDKGYLRIQKAWRNAIREKVEKSIYEVESDVAVPVEMASNKREYMARTLRPKILNCFKDVLKDIDNQIVETDDLIMNYRQTHIPKHSVCDIEDVLKKYRRNARNVRFIGGHSMAVYQFEVFLEHKLPKYSEKSNHPEDECVSLISPYLHFGQISPLELIGMTGHKYDFDDLFVRDFLEQLVVRRELAVNFVHYTENYDSLDSLPDWAKKTLEDHRYDRREYMYSYEEFEDGITHDPYWNACMKEMRETGFIHGYMRMYWGKKIMEWSGSPEIAYNTILSLNNKYFLDGRDPVSYTSVLWLFGLHDQAWQERPVFGKIRYMNAAGLKRKFDIENYVERV